MILKKIVLSTFIALASVSTLTGCHTDEHTMEAERSELNVVGLAQTRPELSTLVAAVQAAGLVDTLSSEDQQFTVFAPTNDAFAKLISDLNTTPQALLSNTELLTDVLTYHTLSSEVQSTAIPFGDFITTVNGNGFVINDDVTITDATGNVSKITDTDILASNGVIHIIDEVILPPNQNIVEIASGNEDFSILVEAVAKAGLVDTLQGDGPFTVFAPTNAAFAAALEELGVTKEELLARSDLADILTYHVVGAKAYSSALPLSGVATVQGETIDVSADAKITDANGRMATITATDIQATNGVIHVIDKVILPML